MTRPHFLLLSTALLTMAAEAPSRGPIEFLGVPNPVTERGQTSKIDVHKDGTKLLYCSGNNVIVHDLTDPKKHEIYKEHLEPTTVARFAPNGNWVASADRSGKVRVWAFDHPERLLKVEVTAFAGEVKDLQWGPESKRIIAVGNGRGSLCKAFTWDTGNSVGDMVGHSKAVNSVAIKPNRPYRAVTGGEDFKVIHYEGPPFKFKHSCTGHTNFVNCVAYAPNGERYATVSADRTGLLFDGKTGEQVGALASEGAHAGGLYGCVFSPDSTQLLTASGDKTCKLWDAASGALIQTFTFGGDAPGIGDMQCAVAWKQDTMLSLSVHGDINLLDPSNPAQPRRVVQSQQGASTCAAVDPESGTIAVGSQDGRAYLWRDGVGTRVTGAVHRNKCVGVAIAGDSLLSVGLDDSLRSASLTLGTYEAETAVDGAPAGLAQAAREPELVVIPTHKGVTVARGTRIVASLPTPWAAAAAAVAPDGSLAAVSSAEEPYAITLYSLAGGVLTEAGTLDGHRSSVTALAFSPDGSLLAAGDGNREIKVWRVEAREAVINHQWVAHGARVNSVAWHPDGVRVVSGGADSHIIIWSVSAPKESIKISFAHRNGVNQVVAGQHLITSVGQDGAVAQWRIPDA